MRNAQSQASLSAPGDISTSSNPQNPASSNPNPPTGLKGPWGLDMKYMGKLNDSPNNSASPIANALSRGMIGRVVR